MLFSGLHIILEKTAKSCKCLKKYYDTIKGTLTESTLNYHLSFSKILFTALSTQPFPTQNIYIVNEGYGRIIRRPKYEYEPVNVTIMQLMSSRVHFDVHIKL